MIHDITTTCSKILDEQIEKALVQCFPEEEQARPVEILAKRLACFSYMDKQRGETYTLDGQPVLWLGPIEYETKHQDNQMTIVMKRKIRRL